LKSCNWNTSDTLPSLDLYWPLYNEIPPSLLMTPYQASNDNYALPRPLMIH